MRMSGQSGVVGGSHDVLVYRDADEYLAQITSFVRTGLAEGAPVLVALPAPQAELLGDIFGPNAALTFADIAELSGNPARIIPALRRFVHNHGGQPTRFVAEPAWAGRSQAELGEITLHDSLLERATAGTPTSLLCVYNSATLPASFVEAAESLHTNATAFDDHAQRGNPEARPDTAAALFASPLPDPPPYAQVLPFEHDLARVRRFVADGIASTGLNSARTQDLLLAVSEVATNTMVHAGGLGVLRLWQDPNSQEVVCDVCDHGHVGDLLTGRLGPYPLAPQSWGLWMVNQVCDLVQLRSGPWGTNVRLHVQTP
jgi:anti-sigma regulatory factor (Ser/Thr protein kinase)